MHIHTHTSPTHTGFGGYLLKMYKCVCIKYINLPPFRHIIIARRLHRMYDKQHSVHIPLISLSVCNRSSK